MLGGYVPEYDDKGNVIGTKPAWLTKEGGLDQSKVAVTYNTDGTWTVVVSQKQKGEGQLDKGTWTIKKTDQGEYEYSRQGHTQFTLSPASGGDYVISPESGNSQSIYDKNGNRLYYCNKILTFGICDVLKPCEGTNKVNCITADPKLPICITGSGEDRCYFEGRQMSYNKDTGKAYAVTSDIMGMPSAVNVLDVKAGEGKVTPVSYDLSLTQILKGEKGTCKINEINCDAETLNAVDSQVFRNRLSKGMAMGLQKAAQVGNFIDLANSYGWWKTDESFKLFDSWFEKNIWLKPITAAEMMLCEMQTDYSDLLDEGFLPTPSGAAGADIQAERYYFEEYNITTGNKSAGYYRYKVTFMVNGQAIFKQWSSDAEGKPLEERKTSFVVYLDSENITGVIALSNKETLSAGTGSIGHPIVVKSEKPPFSEACIEFSDTSDFDPYIKDYLGSDGKLCNTVEDAYVPSLTVLPVAAAAPAAEGGGGGGETSPIPSGEVEI